MKFALWIWIFFCLSMGSFCLAQNAFYSYESYPTVPMPKTRLQDEIKKRVEKIRDVYGIDVYYDQDFLIDAKGNRISGNCVSPQKALRTMNVIAEFLKAYPIEFIQKNIGAIYLYDGLKFNEQPVGGLSGSVGDTYKRGIILDLANSYESDAANVLDDEIDTEFVLRVLHHELAHNMLIKYQKSFPLDEWLKANDSDFKYYGNPYAFVKAVGREKSLESTDDLRREGFVKGYSQSAVEEDIATMAEAFYTTPKQLSDWMNSYPRLARKVELFDQFYRSIGAK